MFPSFVAKIVMKKIVSSVIAFSTIAMLAAKQSSIKFGGNLIG